MEKKKCLECGVIKELSEFNKGGFSLDGHQNECRNCTRKATRKWNKENKSKQKDKYIKDTYGISLEQYEEILIKQKHGCAMCGKSAKDNKKALAVDHCHSTGKVRELLCTKCNMGLGYFNDDIELLNKAIKYLRKHLK